MGKWIRQQAVFLSLRYALWSKVYVLLLTLSFVCVLTDEGASQAPPLVETDERQEVTPDAPTQPPQAPEDGRNAQSGLDPENTTPEKDELLAKGDNLSFHNNLIQIHGNGLIKYEDVVLYADHIWADFNENIMRAAGNVRLIVGNEETFANELIYRLDTKRGIVREGFTYNDPWYYRGSEIFKVEDDESYIRGGSLTTCSLKHPHFYFSASQIIVKIDRELIAKNVVLRVGGIPLFYFPVYRRDLRKDKVAKIIVKIGTDSYQGAFLSIILPLARRQRYDGALLFDQSSRRGRGYGFEGKYRFNDVKFQEIQIPVPKEATPSDRAKFEEIANRLSDRLRGEFDRYKLKQVYLEYTITDEDLATAHETIEEIYAQLQAGETDFAQAAQDNSAHQETRYQGGDMGFLVPGELDAEGKPKLDPILEEAVFQLQEGEMTPILRTETAFHLLKVERVLEVYGQRELLIRRLDIAIQPTQETRTAMQDLANEIYERVTAGAALAQVTPEYENADVSDVNQGEWLPLNEMDRRWRYSVRRLAQPGEVTRPVNTERGVYLFTLVEKEPTPTFEEVARDFELEWETLQQELEAQAEATQEEQPTEAAEEAPESEEVGDEAETEDEEIEVYKKHGFRGHWEDAREISSQAQRLDRGESSNVIKTNKGYHLINVDKKRTYRGDLFFYTNDEYSFSREDPFRTGQRWTLRWGHRHAIYTPWDNREKGRQPLSFVGRVEWRAKYLKEGFGDDESTIDSFGVFTWGSAFSALDLNDRDEEGNLTFAQKTLGEFTGRLQFNHSLDLTGEGTTTLQKLPLLSLSLSRMRLNGLPLFKALNAGMLKVASKLDTDLPIISLLGFPTLENTSFDLDVELGNFFRQQYQDEENIYLQTADIGFDLRKGATLQVTPTREIRVDTDLSYSLIWHARDREGNRNIFRNVYSARISANNTLFRIYDISFIPGARRMRHQVNSTLTFDYAPPIQEEDAPQLYPFGPSVYFFERKRLTYRFDTSLEIKTRRSQSALRILQFDTRLTADFTKFEALNERRYEPIESTLTFVPLASRRLNLTVRTTHDPNESELDGKRFKMVGFRSNASYRHNTWDLSLGNSFTKRTRFASRTITGSFGYRPPSRLWEFDVSFNYDWIAKQFYSQSVTFRRNLHDWDLRIRWNRTGLKSDDSSFGNNVRQDFTFQINLISEPAASAGIGYDASTDTWGFRSLPVGVPYNSFGATNALGRSYF